MDKRGLPVTNLKPLKSTSSYMQLKFSRSRRNSNEKAVIPIARLKKSLNKLKLFESRHRSISEVESLHDSSVNKEQLEAEIEEDESFIARPIRENSELEKVLLGIRKNSKADEAMVNDTDFMVE